MPCRFWTERGRGKGGETGRQNTRVAGASDESRKWAGMGPKIGERKERKKSSTDLVWGGKTVIPRPTREKKKKRDWKQKKRLGEWRVSLSTC